MSFLNIIEQYENFDFESFIKKIQPSDIEAILSKEKLDAMDFLSLISPAADPYLESMARMSHALTIQNFGRVIQLYIPLYLSNFCTNECLYCGFNRKNPISRTTLTLEEIETNAREISKTGIKHILILTGEAPELTPLSYLKDSVRVLKKYFSSISIEIFPMETSDYIELKEAGVDGLTVYQEVYDRKIYSEVHLRGKKRDYPYRLDTPERGAIAGLRSLNIGPLFGLGDPLKEAFFEGLHAAYLQDRYPETEIGLSLPRINPAEGHFQSVRPLDDRSMVRLILAFRLFLPRAGIAISTRERPSFRDHLIPLGVTRLSAGSVTSVGGYTKEGQTPQFEISDCRSASEIADVIQASGYEPVFKDWVLF